ncbi:MAG: hypothetical protein O7H40_16935, partial [Gammaproteobacteria bacterium]|nr:hypothetical protein [Gammaproteobacteria bacterium]
AQQPEADMKDDESGKRLYNRHGRVSRMGLADHTAAAPARGRKLYSPARPRPVYFGKNRDTAR